MCCDCVSEKFTSSESLQTLEFPEAYSSVLAFGELSPMTRLPQKLDSAAICVVVCLFEAGRTLVA
jgi:hypothetical protein